ncbi:DUF2304 domain-containing protein [Anaerotruncus colihominis]|uniref:DUF2304 domain-containing protein n=1 Tax=Anaerotruncus colihominis TaxID=169435 RepID=UPI003517005B
MMDITLRIVLTLGTLAYLAIIWHFLRKQRLNLKYTLLWLLTAAIMLFSVVFPDIVGKLAHLIGIKTSINFVVTAGGCFVLLILLSLTVVASHLTSRVYRLAQMHAILEKRVRDLETGQGKTDHE